MGYKVVANNPGLNMHPFLRPEIEGSLMSTSPGSWKAANSALGSPCFHPHTARPLLSCGIVSYPVTQEKVSCVPTSGITDKISALAMRQVDAIFSDVLL